MNVSTDPSTDRAWKSLALPFEVVFGTRCSVLRIRGFGLVGDLMDASRSDCRSAVVAGSKKGSAGEEDDEARFELMRTENIFVTGWSFSRREYCIRKWSFFKFDAVALHMHLRDGSSVGHKIPTDRVKVRSKGSRQPCDAP